MYQRGRPLDTQLAWLLLAGSLEALQQAAILAAAPFLVVMVGLAVSLLRAVE